jgi:hypothetical protein
MPPTITLMIVATAVPTVEMKTFQGHGRRGENVECGHCVGLAGRGRPPQAAARRVGLDGAEKVLTKRESGPATQLHLPIQPGPLLVSQRRAGGPWQSVRRG